MLSIKMRGFRRASLPGEARSRPSYTWSVRLQRDMLTMRLPRGLCDLWSSTRVGDGVMLMIYFIVCVYLYVCPLELCGCTALWAVPMARRRAQ